MAAEPTEQTPEEDYIEILTNAKPGYLRAMLKSILTEDERKQITGGISSLNNIEKAYNELVKHQDRIKIKFGATLKEYLKEQWPISANLAVIPFVCEEMALGDVLTCLEERCGATLEPGHQVLWPKIPEFQYGESLGHNKNARVKTIKLAKDGSIIFRCQCDVYYTTRDDPDEMRSTIHKQVVYRRITMTSYDERHFVLVEHNKKKESDVLVHSLLKAVTGEDVQMSYFYEDPSVIAEKLEGENLILLVADDPEAKHDKVAYYAAKKGKLCPDDDDRIKKAEGARSKERGYELTATHFDDWEEKGVVTVKFHDDWWYISLPRKVSQLALDEAIKLLVENNGSDPA